MMRGPLFLLLLLMAAGQPSVLEVRESRRAVAREDVGGFIEVQLHTERAVPMRVVVHERAIDVRTQMFPSGAPVRAHFGPGVVRVPRLPRYATGPVDVIVDSQITDNPHVVLRHVVMLNQPAEMGARLPDIPHVRAGSDARYVARPVFGIVPQAAALVEIVSGATLGPLPALAPAAPAGPLATSSKRASHAGAVLLTVSVGVACLVVTVALAAARARPSAKSYGGGDDVALLASLGEGASPAFWANRGNADAQP